MPRPRALAAPLLLAACLTLWSAPATPAVPAPHAAAAAPAAPAALPGLAARAPDRDERPNIVVVMADDLRVDDVQWMPRTRRLFARTGISFENSFAPYPLCCPARATFLTGQHAHNHGVYWHDPPYGDGAFDDSRTVATSLQAAGYRTGFLGKYLNRYGLDRSKVSGKPSHRYVPRGWDEWRGAVENPGDAGFHGGTYVYTDIAFNHDGRIDNRYRGQYSTEVIGSLSAQMADRFAERRARTGRPFFLYVNHIAPHHGAPRDDDDPASWRDADGFEHRFPTPYVPPRHRGRFDDVIDRAPGIARTGSPSEGDVSDKPEAVRRLPAMTRRDLVAMREAARQRAESVWVMDNEVTRLVRRLKKDDEWDRTVLVVTSDNGLLQGEHRFRTGKVWSYEPSLRVPLLVTGPGMRGRGDGGHRRYDPVDTPDLTATILDLAGAEPPRKADGSSFQAALTDGDAGWTVPVLTEATHTAGGRSAAFGKRSSIGLRTARWSMTLYRDGFGELYDLVEDPLQHHNLWRSKQHRQVREDLEKAWRRLRDCSGAGCQEPAPAAYQADAATVADWTRGYWEQIDRTYGYR